MKLDLNDLHVVAAIAGAGSLQGAAQALQLNHATVFRRLQALEEKLGCRLFERHAGVYTATPAGEELAQTGQEIALQAQASLRKVSGQDLRISGEVRLATTDSLAADLVMPAVATCHALYPDVRLQIVSANVMSNLSRREADLALRPTRTPPPHLLGKRLGPLAFAVYGSAQYLADHPQAEFAGHRWIALDETMQQHATLRWLAQYVAPEAIGLRCNTLLSIRYACRQGLGLAILPCFLAGPGSGLRRFSPPLPECATELWLLMHPDLRHTARIRAVHQVLAEHCAQFADLLAGTNNDSAEPS